MILNLHKVPKIGKTYSLTEISAQQRTSTSSTRCSNRIKTRPSHRAQYPLQHMLFVFFVDIILEIVRVAVAV